MENKNQFYHAYSIAGSAEKAVAEASESLAMAAAETDIDLLMLFAAGFSTDELDRALAGVQAATGAHHVVGCSCETAIAGGLELENEQAVSLWAASLPTAQIESFHLSYERAIDGGAITGWPTGFEAGWQEDSTLFLLGDPFTFPAEVLLEQINDERPGTTVVGGMASGTFQPGQLRLLHNQGLHREGMVAVRISGVPIAAVVSQGCRPIGEPMVITAAERNVIQALGGKPAYAQLKSVFEQLPTREKQMVQNGLHVGRVINEYQESFAYGDFLIRNVVALDEQLQTISIGDYVRPGQTVQFHIRDAESASVELEQLLGRVESVEPKSALLFTCNGRGLNLFSDPNHDAAMVQKRLSRSGVTDELPVAGFFAAGEIGPVGPSNFIHGFTAVVALFG